MVCPAARWTLEADCCAALPFHSRSWISGVAHVPYRKTESQARCSTATARLGATRRGWLQSSELVRGTAWSGACFTCAGAHGPTRGAM